MSGNISDFIENACDELQNALTDLYENEDNAEEYERVNYLLRLVSKKADEWANDAAVETEK